ncbi:MAG: hypothetical protein K2N52_05970, partial [Clostridia bacterium]|nr:hypothetical protein [Clostridia bacterium]
DSRVGDSGTMNLFYYFGDAYKEISELLKNFEAEDIAYSDYFASASYIPAELGTVVAGLTLLSVCVLSIFALVYSVLCLMGKTKKTGGGLAIASFVAYLAGALALYALNNAYVKSVSGYYTTVVDCTVDGATLAGISLCSVFAILYFGFNVASRGRELLKARTIVQCVLSLAGFGILVAIVTLLAKPTLSMEIAGSSDNVFNYSLMYVLGLLVALCQGWDESEAVLNRNEATAYIVIAYVMLAITIVLAVFVLAGFAKKMSQNNSKRHLAVCVLLSVFALLFMVFTIVACKEFITATEYLGNESDDSLSFVYTVPIAVFVLSIVALAVSVVQCCLAGKKPPVNPAEVAAEVNVLS